MKNKAKKQSNKTQSASAGGTPEAPKSPAVLKVAQIAPAAYNPRTITPEQFEVLGRSMTEFGDISGITFNVRTGNTVGGHQRVKHLDPEWTVVKEEHKDKVGTVAVGYVETPWGRFSYREVDWSEEKEKLANLAANKIGGDFNFDEVAKILSELDGKSDLSLSGFDHAEILSILDGLSKPLDVEDLMDENEALNFNIRCENMDELKQIQDRFELDGRRTTFANFMEKLDAMINAHGVGKEE